MIAANRDWSACTCPRRQQALTHPAPTRNGQSDLDVGLDGILKEAFTEERVFVRAEIQTRRGRSCTTVTNSVQP